MTMSATLPEDGPLLIVANEFFDALPIEQFGRTGGRSRSGWTTAASCATGEVGARGVAGLRSRSPRELARRLAAQGGAALIVDYGYAGPSGGDTLQAVSRHAFADPWAAPGEHDLTAHVDFAALAEAARREGARVFGPVGAGRMAGRAGHRRARRGA